MIGRVNRDGFCEPVHIILVRVSFASMTYCGLKTNFHAKVTRDCVSGLSALGVLCPKCAKKFIAETGKMS